MFSLDICFCWFEYFLFLVIKQGQRKLGGGARKLILDYIKPMIFYLNVFLFVIQKILV